MLIPYTTITDKEANKAAGKVTNFRNELWRGLDTFLFNVPEFAREVCPSIPASLIGSISGKTVTNR